MTVSTDPLLDGDLRVEVPAPSTAVQWRSRRRSVLWAVVGGVLTTASVPPFGWWVMAFPGVALLIAVVAGAGPRRRFAVGAAFGLGLYLPSLWWMTAFSLPGGVFVGTLEATVTGLAMLAAHPGQRRDPSPRWQTLLSVPAALVLADVLRSLWPFGGLPLGGIDLGQADGPLAATVTFGGRLLLVACVGAGGAALLLAFNARVRSGAGVALATGIVCALTIVLPDGTHDTGTLKVAVVQGGGPLGLRASDANAEWTWQAHLAATELITEPVDLILWPENTVSVEKFAGSQKERTLQGIARARNATLSAGLVEGDGPEHFRNAQLAWGPDGRQVDRFEKVRRVPYGEYFPFREQIESWGLAELPARDATPGTTAGFLRTPAGRFAVAISYEGFFDDRSRGGVRAGGQALLIPTNASSYRTSHVPSQQVAAARLRAREVRRWTMQAAPTGFSAVISPDGTLVERTAMRARDVLIHTIALREGLTPYARFNDAPLVGLALAALAFSRRPRRQALEQLTRRRAATPAAAPADPS